MASVYSGASWTGTYTYTRVRVDYSGTSATAHLLYTRTNSWSGATGSGDATFSFGGASVRFNQTRYGQMTDSELASVSFSISMSGGTYSGSSSGGYMGGSWSVSIPAQYTDPSGLSVSISELYTDGAKFNVSLSSYGNPSSASGRYIEAAILNQNTYGATYRYNVAFNTTSANIDVTNSGGGTLNIQPNTQYYYGAYATNTQRAISKVQSTFVTLAKAPTFSVSSVAEKSAVIAYSTSADGGKYSKSIQYSKNNGSSWTTGATVSTGSASSGTFTISGLDDDTTYSIKTRVVTSAGTTSGSNVNFTTLPAYKTYVSVGSKAKKVKKLYVSVGGKAKKVKKLYVSVGGKAKRVL